MRNSDKWGSRLVAVLAVVLFALAVVIGVRELPGTKAGDFDPASLTVAILAFVTSGWFGWKSLLLSKQSLLWNDTDAAGQATRLAHAIAEEERDVRADLLGGAKPVDVDYRVREAPAHNAVGATRQGTLFEVVDFYKRLQPQRLVITGAGGAGKTVLALDLMLGLLAARADPDPVPLRISAATWTVGELIDDWLVSHLIGAYGLTTAAARTLVRARMILPVIDGIDEMDLDAAPGYSSRAARLFEALNVYQRGRTRAPIVVTCRTGQLDALEAKQVWVHDAATIEILPVSIAKAEQFLRDSVIDAGRWQPVFSRMSFRPDGALAKALSTPWRLTLARTVYEQRDDEGAFLRRPVALVGIEWTGPDKVRDHLLSLLIPATAAADDCPYRPEEVQRWLGVLARDYLDRRGGTTAGGVPISNTDVVLHRLWPLAGVGRIRFVATLITCLAIGVAMAGELSRVNSTALSPAVIALVSVAAAAPFAVLTLFSSLARAEPYRFALPKRRARGKKTLRRFVLFALLLSATLAAVGYAAVAVSDRAVAVWVLWAIPLCGIAFGVIALSRDDAAVSARHPRELLAADIRSVLLLSVVSAAFTTVLIRVYPPPLAAASFGWVLGPVFGIVIAWTLAPTSLFYLALLILSRRRSRHPLPWQLGEFLDWCRAQGLLRTAGIAYQFRHREIQDFLAAG